MKDRITGFVLGVAIMLCLLLTIGASRNQDEVGRYQIVERGTALMLAVDSMTGACYVSLWPDKNAGPEDYNWERVVDPIKAD